MDEKRRDIGERTEHESPTQGRDLGDGESPLSGTKPTGQAPQGAGGDPLMGDPGRDDASGSRGQTSRGESGDMESGQVNGLGGPGDRTNLSGLAGPEKTNWNDEPERSTDEGES